MNLADTSDLIRLVTSTTADIHVSAEWADWPTAGGFTPGHTTTLITTATTTTVVASPAASTVRQVKQLMIANRHASTANVVSVEHFDGTNAARVWSASLAAGESLSYDGQKWVRLNANGYIALEDAVISTDGNAYYANNGGGGQGIVPVVHFIRASADQTLTSTTSAQNIFDSPTSGALTIAAGAYWFQILVQITGMSATSGNGQVLMGGTATLADFNWFLQGLDGALVTAAADLSTYAITNATAAPAFTATTQTTMRFQGWGAFECSSPGTWIPQIALTTAAAAIVEQSSICLVQRIGAASVNSVGAWT